MTPRTRSSADGRPAVAATKAAPPQSLASGAAGAALLHIERATTGAGTWEAAHAWLAEATRTPLDTGPHARLYFGAPAVAFTLATAAGPDRYRRALTAADAHVSAITRDRLRAAHTRIEAGHRPHVGEFDLINGLTGLGALWWRRDPHSPLLAEVLSYLIRLTEPVNGLPGWWSNRPPSGIRSRSGTGGHSNQGMAHGITGPLALLSLAARARISVPGHTEAITRICTWLDTWRQDHPSGPWWPEVLTRDDIERGRPAQTRPGRPSWCYGTPGLARAQQLAGLATGDAERSKMAARALSGCLGDPDQIALLTDDGLCHGRAGTFQTAWRTAADTPLPALSTQVRELGARLVTTDSEGTVGFLCGSAGHALAVETASSDRSPASGWDTSLLLN